MAKPTKRSASAIAAAMMGTGGRTAKAAKVTARPAAKAAKPAKPAAAKPRPAKAPKAAATKHAQPATTPASLAECAVLVERGELAAALDALLDAWRAAPSIALADVIVRLGDIAREPAAWASLRGTPAAPVVTALLATVSDDGAKQALPRLEVMAGWPADPRVDRWVAQQYLDVPYTSTGARPYWTRLLPLASKIVDPVAARRLEEAGAKPGVLPWIAEYVQRIRTELAAIPDAPPTAEVAAAVPAITAALDRHAAAGRHAHADTADALLAAVLANPADEAARAVLRDVLLEAGHPRGELMALQDEATRRPLTAAEKKREKALISDHRAELLGTLDAAITKDCTFARGFVTRVELRGGGAGKTLAAIAKSVGDPLWATVEHLEGPYDADITRHPVMRSLRSLVASDAALEWLAAHPRLEALARMRVRDPWLPLLDTGFPALRELVVDAQVDHARAVLASPLARRLARLELWIPMLRTGLSEELLALFDRAGECPATETTLRLVRQRHADWSCGFRFRRGDAGLEVAVFTTTIRDNWEPYILQDALGGLERVAALRPAAVTLEQNLRVPEHAERLAAAVAALAR